MPDSTPTVDPVLPTVAPDQFFAVDIRSARVLEVLEFPEARKPAYKLRLDLGPLGERMSSAQITAHYTKEDLVGTTVVCVVNFPARRIADFRSEVLVLGVYDRDGEVVLLQPERPVAPGRRVG